MTAEQFWAQPKDALPDWLIARSHDIESHNQRLGSGGTMLEAIAAQCTPLDVQDGKMC